MSREPLLDEIHQRLGHRRLSRCWAKAGIFLGLSIAGLGLFCGFFALTQPAPLWGLLVGGSALFVLGGYLALAGHRSHLYQSANENLALLLEILRQLHSKGSPT